MKQDPIEKLKADGWREYSNQCNEYARCFYKRFETPTRCASSNDWSGIHVGMSLYGLAMPDNTRKNIEIDVCGELPDGTWINMLNHGMGDDIDKAISAIPRILAAWETCCNFKA